MKYLFVILFILLNACVNKPSLSEKTILWEFHPNNQQNQWDAQAFQLLNAYQTVQNNFTNYDTLVVKSVVLQLISATDTLLAHASNSDSLTQNTWIPGLQSCRNELEALILETDSVLKMEQLNMCTIALIHFLADIGYAKTNVYIFTQIKEDKEYYWIGSNNHSKNPFDQKDKTIFTASYTLQEP